MPDGAAMINKIALFTTVIILACIGLLMAIAFHYFGKTVSQASALTALTQQKNEAEFIMKSQALSVGIFNQIAGAALNEQKANASASSDWQTVIKTVLETAPCAVVPIPTAANDSLLEHYNKTRQGAGNTDTGKSAGGMRSLTTTC